MHLVFAKYLIQTWQLWVLETDAENQWVHCSQAVYVLWGQTSSLPSAQFCEDAEQTNVSVHSAVGVEVGGGEGQTAAEGP